MDRSGRKKVRFYWLVVSGLILATASTVYALTPTVTFTGTGSNVVAGYWNIGMTGGTVSVSGATPGNTIFLKIRFDGAEDAYTWSQADAGSDGAEDILVTAGEIEAMGNFGNGKVITFRAYTGAPDEGFSAGDTIDQIQPSVSNVNSSTSDAAIKKIGNVIDVDVTFSETVTVTVGTPQIEFETGTSDALVDYNSGSGTATLTFPYTVASGHTSGDLRYTSSGALSPNGAVIKDAAGNSAVLTLPAPGTTNSLGANKDFVVDGIRPEVSNVTAATPDGAYKVDEVIFVIVNFTEAVTVSGTPQIYLETGASDTYVNHTSGSGTSSLTFNYTVLAGHTTSDLGYKSTSALSAGTSIKDAAGNDAVMTLAAPEAAGSLRANKNIIIDTTDPTVLSVTSTQLNGSYKEGDVIPITITFSEAVDVTGTPTLSLNSSGVANYTSGSGTTVLTFNYSIGGGENSSDLDYVDTASLSLSGGTIQDAAANTAVLTLPVVGSGNSLGGSKNLVIDTDPPSVSGVSSVTANGTKKIGDLIAITVTFDEAVTVTGTPQITLETGASDEVVDYTSGTGTTVLTFNYTVAEWNTSNDLDYAATSSLAGTIKDAAGNNAVLTLPTPGAVGSLGANKDFIVDGVRPTISAVTSGAANGSYNASDVIPITVTFSEVVTVSGVPQITLAVPGGYAVDYSSGSGSGVLTFNYTVQSGHTTSDLEYASTSSLSAGTFIKDAAGNDATLTLPGLGSAGSLGGSKDLIVDTTLPTVTNVTSSVANDAYKAGETIPVTVTFSEAVTVTGSPTLALETGAIDRNATYSSGTGTTILTFSYTVQSGDVSSDLDYVDANSLTEGISIQDAALNNATLTLPTPGVAGSLGANKDIVIDTEAPTVANVTSSTGDGAYKAGESIAVTVTFSEAVYVTGTPELALDVGTSATYASGDGSNTLTFNYTVSPGETSADLAYTATNALTVVAASIKDLAGNDATLTLANPGDPNSLSDNKDLVIDTTDPTVTSVSSTAADGYYVETDLIPITVTFTETVYVGGVGTPTMALETGATDAVVDYTAGSGTSALSFPYTVASGHESDNLDYTGTTALALNLGTIQDAAGNAAILTLAAPGESGSLGFSKNRDVDAIIPTVTGVTSTKADGIYKAGVVIPISVVFSEAVAVAGGVPTLTLNVDGGYAVDYTSVSGDTLVFEYTVLAGQNQVDLDYLSTTALSTNGSTIRDVAGNDAVVTLVSPGSANSLGGSKNIDVDTTPPTVSNVTSTTSNAAYNAGQSIDVRVTFSEDVIDAGSPSVILETGTIDRSATYVSGKGTNTLVFSYTVVAGDSSDDLDYVSTGSLVAGISLEDSAGNQVSATPLAAPGAAGSLGANKAIIIDTEEPTVLNVTSNKTDGYYKAGVTIPIAVVFSEAVTVTGIPTLTLDLGAGYAVDYANRISGDTLFFDYTVQPGHTSADLVYTLPGALGISGTIQDAAGNDAIRTLADPGDPSSLSGNKDLVIDTTDPTVTSVSSTAADGYYVAGDTIFIAVNFTETVYMAGVGTPTLALETGSTDAVLDYASGSGTNTLTFIYIVALGHESDNLEYADANALQLNLATIRDTTGNNADLILPTPGTSGSLGYGKDRNIDAIIPTVTIVTSTIADGAYKAGVVIPIAVVFSENVGVLGTPTLTLDVGGGYDVDYANRTSGDTLFFDYTILPGHNKIDLGYVSTTALKLNGGSIQDAATNPADTVLQSPTDPASLSGAKNLDVDTTPPVLSSVAPADSSYRNSTVVSYTLSEDLASGTITWSRTGGAADPTVHIQALTGTELTAGAHTDITLTNDPALVSGTVYSVTFAGLDAAGNAATNVVRIDVTFDDTPPQAVITYSDTLAAKSDTVVITATFTEVTLATPQIAFAYQATSVAATAMDTTAYSTVFTYDAIIPSVNNNDGVVTITITAEDLAGNPLTTDSTANRSDLTIDDTPPGYVLAYSDSLVKHDDPLIITATFTEPAKPTPLISLNFADTSIDSVAMTIGDADTIWTYETTAPDSNDGFVTVTIAGTDLAENVMIPVSGSTNTLLVDNTPPEITVAEPDSGDFRQTTAVVYTLPQAIDSGTVTWTRESGPVDGTPHVQILTASETAAGTHDTVLIDAPTLVQGTTYTLDFIIIDKAGNPDTTTIESVMFDTLAPNIADAVLQDGLATDDIDSTQSTTSLSGRYYGFVDDDAGIALYEYAIGSTKGDTDLVGWTDNATETAFTATGLSLDLKVWYWLMARATDQAGNVSDTVFSEDGVRIIARPAPTVAVVQNSALPAYLQIFITDTLGMANTITVKADGVPITHSVIDAFTYLANHKLLAAGILDVEVTGHSAAGDSTVSASMSIALAKRGQPWVAASVDQRFRTAGLPGSVSGDRYLLVVDSTLMGLSAALGGAYRLGDGQLSFNQPVRVSLRPAANEVGQEEAQAIYILRSNGRWEELPSVDEGELVTTWANGTGTFRLGRRTIIVPQTTSLYQNYPNPFNPTTRIVFDLGYQEGPERQASVIIYNLLGQEVRTLFDGVTPAGHYELVWRGIDRRGAPVASGVYFVRLLTGSGRVATKKMLLVR